ncbi:tRNA (adenosine(37)-N6)-dimethylallyltransferase MiaA [Polymorphobacter arshaanensis]|uniref:tRNA dimethylallyltransferase n=1 Tax=Glacieibacterium arshaanense TaxID=2511025 RepID=A0A4Y9ER72_9SPHN|nr:tRNA (adenosine(37)-N6)-dimethylallyltransferase MiaA [Polymorphobacter arshaanensis]TFU06115.1 tRNA (adenosine(37)-N6)-dimethylallyltransferase MiaA [Polymorphobacter arshaanensis]
MSESSRARLVVIAGPTASGKSAHALALAKAENGVIINADASQVYADLRVLSARPSPEEEAQAPHRLYGVIDGAVACSAAGWAELAKAEVAAAHAAGQLPIVTGGTGLYIRTLLDGIAPVPEIDPGVRGEVRALGAEAAWAALEREDPAMAKRLNRADRQRVARALEVMRATRRSLADWQQQLEGGIGADVELDARVVTLPRDQLYKRCDARLVAMVNEGALDEVAALLARHLAPDLPVMKALGVRAFAAQLAGRSDAASALADAQRETRNFAKRQTTWFNNQSPGWPRIAG